jgi:hypothetical protein
MQFVSLRRKSMRKFRSNRSCQASGLSLLACAFVLTQPSFAEAPAGECPTGTPRVYVDKDANIALNGQRMTSQELEEALLTMSPKPAQVCYAHGLLQGNPIPGALSAMRVLVGLEMDVVLYTDETFRTLDPEN